MPCWYKGNLNQTGIRVELLIPTSLPDFFLIRKVVYNSFHVKACQILYIRILSGQHLKRFFVEMTPVIM